MSYVEVPRYRSGGDLSDRFASGLQGCNRIVHLLIDPLRLVKSFGRRSMSRFVRGGGFAVADLRSVIN